MKKRRLSICLFLTFLACCYANIEPNTRACIGNYELSFFCDLKQFGDAKQVCKNKGSHLVKIDNENMTKVIGDVISTLNQMGCDITNSPYGFYAGAIADSNRRWTWLDGSELHLREEDGYQNWQIGQPNDLGGEEDCLRVSQFSTKWFDSPCNGIGEQKYYICQKNLSLNIVIKELSYNALECSSPGICVNQVEWRRNNATVLTSQNQSVYQELSAGKSILHYENATINDEGEYFCVTWVKKNKQNKNAVTEIIKVKGSPAIEAIIPSPCNTSLIIYWYPNKRALGFPHRIVVNDSMSRELMKNIIGPPIKDVQQRTEVSDLQPFTTYKIQLSACIDEESCPDGLIANATATTWGIVTKNATMHQLDDNDKCIVIWNWPHDIPTVFKLEISSSSGVNTSFVNRSAKNTDKGLNFSFEMQPEQTYEVLIQANGSKEICPQPVNVVGTCRGKDIPTTNTTTTIAEAKFTTDLSQVNALSDISMIVTPVSAGVFVVLIIVGIVIICKRRRSQDVKISKENPIYGVTNNAAAESTYDNLHSSSENKKCNEPDKSTRKLSQPFPEVVFNPLYSDIGMETSSEVQNIDVKASAEDNDAPVYSAISKPKKKIPNKETYSEENDSKSPPSTPQQDDDVYAVVDNKKKKCEKSI